MEELLKNNKSIQILTDSGWSDFDGLMVMGKKPTVCVELDNGETLICTPDHKVFVESMTKIEAEKLLVGQKVITSDGTQQVKNIHLDKSRLVYDIHNVKKHNRFYANNLLISNCEFVIYEETLINPLYLIEMTGLDPIRHMGQVRWYKHPNPNYKYVVSLDPSSGTGGDYAGIQVLELPTMTQVAEWQHNKTPVEGQIKTMMGILQYLKEMGVKDIYWSVENNSIGEAALVVIRDTGEETFPGDFIHEPKKVAGKRGRKGFHTGHKTKMEACLSLKRLVENDKLKLQSKPLISELKNFVARGSSFAAKPGEHDDLVMSLVLNLRMIEYIATFEDDVYDAVNSNLALDSLSDYEEDWEGPMPLDWL